MSHTPSQNIAAEVMVKAVFQKRSSKKNPNVFDWQSCEAVVFVEVA